MKLKFGFFVAVCLIFSLTSCDYGLSNSSGNEPSSNVRITSFSFLAANNAGLNEDVVGVISETAWGPTIKLCIPFSFNASSVVPSIVYNGTSIELSSTATGEVLNTTGEAINLTDEALCIIADDNSTASYKILILMTVTRTQLGEMIVNGDDITFVDTSAITDMSVLCAEQYMMVNPDPNLAINGSMKYWDVSNVTTMDNMFMYIGTFAGLDRFDFHFWDVSNVTNMRSLFSCNDNINPSISLWDVGNVTDMRQMFSSNRAFNCDISQWDVSNVTNMNHMFFSATSFNQDISQWVVSNVTDMGHMFNGNNNIYTGNIDSVFNQDISRWDVRKVTNMESMFRNNAHFNQDISIWDVSNVTNMEKMFWDANAFNQNLRPWADHVGENDINHTNFTDGLSPLSTANHPYDSWDM